MTKRKRKEHKIIAGLKEAVDHVATNGGEVQESPYDHAKKRVVAAVAELNAAMDEAHKCADMRVFAQFSECNGDNAGSYRVSIYRLDYAEMAFTVTVKPKEKMMWQVMKQDAWKMAGKLS